MKEAGLSPREIREYDEEIREAGRPDFERDLSTMRRAEEVAAEMYEAVPGSFEQHRARHPA